MAHSRRKFGELRIGNQSTIISEAIAMIERLHDIERDICDAVRDARRAQRQQLATPVALTLHAWLSTQCAA